MYVARRLRENAEEPATSAVVLLRGIVRAFDGREINYQVHEQTAGEGGGGGRGQRDNKRPLGRTAVPQQLVVVEVRCKQQSASALQGFSALGTAVVSGFTWDPRMRTAGGGGGGVLVASGTLLPRTAPLELVLPVWEVHCRLQSRDNGEDEVTGTRQKTSGYLSRSLLRAALLFAAFVCVCCVAVLCVDCLPCLLLGQTVAHFRCQPARQRHLLGGLHHARQSVTKFQV